MRTISEVSALLDVPQHVLRFWETRFSALTPLKHAGGRRYYRPADIHLLTRIRDLLHQQGYTIRGAQAVLRQDRANASAAGRSARPEPAADAAAAMAAVEKTNPAAADELRALRLRLRRLRDQLASGKTAEGPDYPARSS